MFKRIWKLITGFFGLFIGGIEKSNPEALLEAEKEALRKQIATFNVGLANHAAMVEKLMSLAKSLAQQETELKAKTTALIKAGQRDAAAEYALKYKKVDVEEDNVRAQLEEAQERYKELVRARDVAIKAARDKIEKLTAGISDMKISNAMADMQEMAAGMTASIGTSGDTLARLEEMVESERHKARGRARVAKDSVDMTEIALKEGETKALADMALAKFAAANSIDIPGAKVGEGGENTNGGQSASVSMGL